jgi:LysR family hydrogen peroxide-inducible transcriptional activator
MMLGQTPVSSLSLRDLEYAVAVARERNFGRAAEACGVSQAALSEQVRKLESILGVWLFERTTRKVEPTARGEVIVRQAERLLGDARRLLDDARRTAEPLSGELRLGAIATLGPYYLPAVIALGRRHFPRLALRLREATTDALLLALRNGELDAVLVALPVPLDGLVADPLFFEPFRLGCPSDHELAQRASVRVRDLAGGPLLLMEDGHCLRDQALALCDSRPLPHQSRYASSLEMLRHMIAAGEGISLIPQLAAAEHATMHGLIAYRELADERAGRTIALVWRATETRADDLRRIAAFMRDELPAGVRPHDLSPGATPPPPHAPPTSTPPSRSDRDRAAPQRRPARRTS